jgi:DNA-directed RNA polymerase
MQTFTGYEYLLIDVANQYGHDKMLFNDRIAWAELNMHHLEELTVSAEVKPLYAKAVQAIRKAQAHQPTGHLVGFDACCSGIQIMSAITGCIAGATATGLVDPNVRADAYSSVTSVMQDILGTQVSVTRKQAKEALMTLNQGSLSK